MTQPISSQQPISFYAPAPGKALSGTQAQGSLFAPALLPRQLPTYKAGPEDDVIFQRLANRNARGGATVH